MIGCALAETQGTEHALRYLSLHDNQYVRYFRGHTARVSALAMSPKNDLFMSAAEVRHTVCMSISPRRIRQTLRCMT